MVDIAVENIGCYLILANQSSNNRLFGGLTQEGQAQHQIALRQGAGHLGKPDWPEYGRCPSGAGMGASGGDNSTSGGTMAAGEAGAGASTAAGGSTSSDPQVAALMAACQGNETSLVMDRMSSM